MTWPGETASIASFTSTAIGKVKQVELLGYSKKLKFKQTPTSLEVSLPQEMKTGGITTLKVTL